jgi:predicted component of type VI protein secretion system
MTNRIILQLLDSAKGHPLQNWTFENRESITLGRAPDNDVVLADPYVSRSHATLKLENNAWRLVSVSPKMILVDDQALSEAPIVAGTVFRLGPSGCYLRFGRPEQHSNHSTMSFDSTLMPVLQLDRQQMERDVGQIVDAEFFQQLKDARRQLRERQPENHNQS